MASLDSVRDFVYTQLRASERFVEEQRAALQYLEGPQAVQDGWLSKAQEALQRGTAFHELAKSSWSAMEEEFEGYLGNVRKLADELALKELSSQSQGQQDPEQETQHDARFVHPELRHFKAEKQAKILGRYGGAPALGAQVLPNPSKTILKATATPAAREIQWSKFEGRDARELAEVMRFKTAAKEEGPSAWQTEIEAKKRGFLGREQQQEAAEAARKKAAAEAASHSTLAKELSDKLNRRHTEVLSTEQQQQLAEAAARQAQKQTSKTEVSDELAQKLARKQRQEQEAEEQQQQAEAARRASESQGEVDGSPQVAVGHPLGAELAAKIRQRNTSGAGANPPDQQGERGKQQEQQQQQQQPVSELQARLQRIREKEGS